MDEMIFQLSTSTIFHGRHVIKRKYEPVSSLTMFILTLLVFFGANTSPISAETLAESVNITKEKIRVSFFCYRDDGEESFLPDLLSEKFSNSDSLSILDRSTIKQILKEHQLSKLGFTTEGEQIKLGRILNVKLFVQAQYLNPTSIRVVIYETDMGTRLADKIFPTENLEKCVDEVSGLITDSVRKMQSKDVKTISISQPVTQQLTLNQEKAIPSLLNAVVTLLVQEHDLKVLEQQYLSAYISEKTIHDNEYIQNRKLDIRIDSHFKRNFPQNDVLMDLRVKNGNLPFSSKNFPLVIETSSAKLIHDQILKLITGQGDTQIHQNRKEEIDELIRAAGEMNKKRLYFEALRKIQAASSLQPDFSEDTLFEYEYQAIYHGMRDTSLRKEAFEVLAQILDRPNVTELFSRNLSNAHRMREEPKSDFEKMIMNKLNSVISDILLRQFQDHVSNKRFNQAIPVFIAIPNIDVNVMQHFIGMLKHIESLAESELKSISLSSLVDFTIDKKTFRPLEFPSLKVAMSDHKIEYVRDTYRIGVFLSGALSSTYSSALNEYQAISEGLYQKAHDLNLQEGYAVRVSDYDHLNFGLIRESWKDTRDVRESSHLLRLWETMAKRGCSASFLSQTDLFLSQVDPMEAYPILMELKENKVAMSHISMGAFNIAFKKIKDIVILDEVLKYDRLETLFNPSEGAIYDSYKQEDLLFLKLNRDGIFYKFDLKKMKATKLPNLSGHFFNIKSSDRYLCALMAQNHGLHFSIIDHTNPSKGIMKFSYENELPGLPKDFALRKDSLLISLNKSRNTTISFCLYDIPTGTFDVIRSPGSEHHILDEFTPTKGLEYDQLQDQYVAKLLDQNKTEKTYLLDPNTFNCRALSEDEAKKWWGRKPDLSDKQQIINGDTWEFNPPTITSGKTGTIQPLKSTLKENALCQLYPELDKKRILAIGHDRVFYIHF